MLTASEIIAIKAKVKAEMQRRCGTGSMTSYAGSSWDFSTTPTSGGKILTEHGHKVIAPLIAVKSQGNLTDAQQGAKMPSDFNNSKLNNIVDGYASEATTTSSSSCQASCSGLCTTGCYSGCTSCTGCTGSCTGSCSSGCSGCSGCGHMCSDDCSSSCEGHCTAKCGGTCFGCTGSCDTGCYGGCEGSCDTSCASTCLGGATDATW